jgi:hypothetical protein
MGTMGFEPTTACCLCFPFVLSIGESVADTIRLKRQVLYRAELRPRIISSLFDIMIKTSIKFSLKTLLKKGKS